MADSETETGQSSAPAAARSARPRRKASRRKTTGTRKTGASRAPARRKRARKAVSVAALLEGFASRAADAGSGLAALSGEGAQAARKALRKAGAASKKTINGLKKEWKGMDTQRRIQVVAAVLGALAAASAPFVRGRRKK